MEATLKNRVTNILVAVDWRHPEQTVFDYGLQMALDQQSSLELVTMIDTDKINIFDVLTKGRLESITQKADQCLTNLKTTAEAYGVKTVTTRTIFSADLDGNLRKIINQDQVDFFVAGQNTQHHWWHLDPLDGLTHKLPCSGVLVKIPKEV